MTDVVQGVSGVWMSDGEEWRQVVGWEGLYEVSSLGRVMQVGNVNLKRDTWGSRLPRIVRAYPRNGYHRVRLRDESGGVRQVTTHVLVAEAFIGPKPFEDAVVRHLDGTRDNNIPGNLAWGTPLENSADRAKHGRDPNLNKTHCPQGHAYSEENTYRAPSTGHRQCLTCMKSRGEASNPRRNLIRRQGLPKDSPRHGTEAGYKHKGCRCEKCKKAYREAYQRRKREALNKY